MTNNSDFKDKNCKIWYKVAEGHQQYALNNIFDLWYKVLYLLGYEAVQKASVMSLLNLHWASCEHAELHTVCSSQKLMTKATGVPRYPNVERGYLHKNVL